MTPQRHSLPELDGNLAPLPREQLLSQPIVPLPLPLLRQECFDLVVAAQEGAAVAPDTGEGVGGGDEGGVARVPEGLGGFHFGVGALGGEWRGVMGHVAVAGSMEIRERRENGRRKEEEGEVRLRLAFSRGESCCCTLGIFLFHPLLAISDLSGLAYTNACEQGEQGDPSPFSALSLPSLPLSLTLFLQNPLSRKRSSHGRHGRHGRQG